MSQCIISVLLVYCFLVMGEEKMVADKDDDSEIRSSKNIFNFASQAAGAVVLDKSPATAKGFSHLLNDDMDKYGISACDEKKWVVIGLSEDILVTSVGLANYEKYSSMLKEFQLLASTSYPTEKWINLGVYEAQPRLGMQTFNVSDSSVHTRYLKIKFNTHHGIEDLCTLSQIKVHGTTVIASFKQEVERSDQHMRDLISHLNGEGGATGAVSGADNSTELGAITAGEPLEKSEANSLLTDGNAPEESSGNVTALVTSTASFEVTADGKTQSMENGTIKAIDNKNSSESGSNQLDLSTGSVVVNATAQNSSEVTGLGLGRVTETAAAGAPEKKNDLTPLPDDGNSDSTSKYGVIVSTASTSIDTLDSAKKPLATTAVSSQSLNTTHNNTSARVPRNETQNTLNSTVITGVTAAVQDTKNQNIEVSVSGSTEQKKDIAINSSQSISVTSDDDDEKANLTTKSTSSISNVSISVKSTSASTLQNDSGKAKTALGKDKIKHDDAQEDADMRSNDTSTDITTTQPDLKVESKMSNSTVKLSISSDVNAAVTVSVLIKKQENALGDKKVNIITTAALKGSDIDTISSRNQLQNKTAINVLNDTRLINVTDAAAAVTQGLDLNKNTINHTVDATVLNTTHTSISTKTSLTLSNTSEVSQAAADKLKSQQNEIKSTATNDTSAGVTATANSTESTTVVNDDKEDKSDLKVNDKDSTAVSTVAVAGLKDENTIISTGVAGSNPIGSLSALGILESPILPTFLSAPPASVRATTGPTAGFSPQCLETLRFSEFQATMANKLKQRAEADKSQVPIHSQDNVFRQLMLKIKTLEMNYAIIEMYSAQVSECYRSALQEIYFNMSQSNSGYHRGHYDTSIENNRRERSLLDAESDEFSMPVGDGVVKVIVSGMGSTASLTAVGIEEQGTGFPRVNSRNCSSSSVKLGQCGGSKLNFLGVATLSTALATTLGPAPSSSACHAKTGYSGIEDISTLSPVLPSQLRATEATSEEDDDEDEDLEVKMKISGSKRIHSHSDSKDGDRNSDTGREGARGISVDIDVRTPDRIPADTVSIEKLVPVKNFEIPIILADKKSDIELDRSEHSHATASLDMIKGLGENELLTILGVAISVALLSLCVSVGTCLLLCHYTGKDRKTSR